MKQLFAALLAALVALGIASCSAKGSGSANSKSGEAPSAEQFLELLKAIPDHGINPGSEEYFTPQYYSLLQQAWAVPSDAIGQIGSDDWLYYFVSGNGDWDGQFNYSITRCADSGNFVLIEFYLNQSGQEREHTLTLLRQGSRWLIADYDNTLQQMQQYIHKQCQYFQSEEWRNYLSTILSADDSFSQEARQRQKEVEEWLGKTTNG